jgi:hypothetical protein
METVFFISPPEGKKDGKKGLFLTDKKSKNFALASKVILSESTWGGGTLKP